MQLLDYQIQGVEFMMDHPRALLGDEMGLGKTAQAIELCNRLESARRVLVVCPAMLKINWQREFEMWDRVGRTTHVVYATARSLPRVSVYIINYDILDRFPGLIRREWDVLICDEAHMLKNPAAQRSQWVKKVAIATPRVVLMTGTPVLNRPREAWNLLYMLDPTKFRDRMRFYRRYCAPRTVTVYTKRGPLTTVNYDGAANLDELRVKVANYMIRRRRLDVLPQLPGKRRMIIDVDLDTSLMSQLQTLALKVLGLETAPQELTEAQWSLAVDALVPPPGRTDATEMSTLRKQIGMAKVRVATKHLAGIDQKAVVFGYHRDVLEALHRAFPQESVLVYGGVKDSIRQERVDRFQNDPECRFFFGQIQAAGVGITLTAACLCVFVEEAWRPGDLTQCEDRLCRIGQRNNVLVQHLVANGTLDAAMVRTTVRKQDIIDRIVG